MKRIIIAGLAVIAIAVSAGADEAGGSKRIGLVNVGGFHEPTLGRIAGHVATHLRTSPKILADRDLAEGDDLQAQAQALAPLVQGDVICVVGIVAAPAEITAHGAISPGDKTAVVNATSLKPEDGDEEKFARRLEKETMRCVGLLLGLAPCPNPRCALRAYGNDVQLDAKGLNFCPPCQKAFEDKRPENHLYLRKVEKDL